MERFGVDAGRLHPVGKVESGANFGPLGLVEQRFSGGDWEGVRRGGIGRQLAQGLEQDGLQGGIFAERTQLVEQCARRRGRLLFELGNEAGEGVGRGQIGKVAKGAGNGVVSAQWRGLLKADAALGQTLDRTFLEEGGKLLHRVGEVGRRMRQRLQPVSARLTVQLDRRTLRFGRHSRKTRPPRHCCRVHKRCAHRLHQSLQSS